MRNSLIPVVAAVLLFGVGLLLIRPTVDRGQGGPEVNAGILRLPKRDPLRTASSALDGITTATITAGAADPGRWQVVVVAGDDREASTRATMLAMGEALYAAGIVAILDPPRLASEPSPPLPLPTDRVLTIATRSADLAGGLRGRWRVVVDIAVEEPRLPDGHPAAALQPPAVATPTRLTVTHETEPAAEADWPGRWAATGRAISTAMLEMLAPAGLTAVAHPPTAWETPLPFPVGTPELRWAGAFQHDLVRGWIGRIPGLTVSAAGGRSEPADAPLRRLLTRGAWDESDAADAWSLWSRRREGHIQRFAVRADADGWTATMWTEHPDPAGLAQRWAEDGDHDRLRALLAAPGLPEAVRAAAERALE